MLRWASAVSRSGHSRERSAGKQCRTPSQGTRAPRRVRRRRTRLAAGDSRSRGVWLSVICPPCCRGALGQSWATGALCGCRSSSPLWRLSTICTCWASAMVRRSRRWICGSQLAAVHGSFEATPARRIWWPRWSKQSRCLLERVGNDAWWCASPGTRTRTRRLRSRSLLISPGTAPRSHFSASWAKPTRRCRADTTICETWSRLPNRIPETCRRGNCSGSCAC